MSKSESDLRNDVRRADQAKMVLNHPLVKSYFDEKRKTIMHNLETAHWSNKEEQDELIRMLRLLGDFEKDFIKHIRGGEKARSLLNKLFRSE